MTTTQTQYTIYVGPNVNITPLISAAKKPNTPSSSITNEHSIAGDGTAGSSTSTKKPSFHTVPPKSAMPVKNQL